MVIIQSLLTGRHPIPASTWSPRHVSLSTNFCFSEPCCAYTLQRASWLLPIVDHGVDNDEEENPFDGLYCARVRQQIWNCFENPHSSKAAKVRHSLMSWGQQYSLSTQRFWWLCPRCFCWPPSACSSSPLSRSSKWGFWWSALISRQLATFRNGPISKIFVPKPIYYHLPILWKHSWSQNDHNKELTGEETQKTFKIKLLLYYQKQQKVE